MIVLATGWVGSRRSKICPDWLAGFNEHLSGLTPARVTFIYTKMYKKIWVLVKFLWNEEGVMWMQ